jgi:deazaflavin-dependent oxidoreductase (nitroreductase family)
MFDIAVTVLVCVAFALIALAVIFVLGMRTRSPLVLGPLFAVMRRVINPRALRSAGGPDTATSIVRCPGRRTGRSYDTPVGVMAVDDGFLIMLPYGRHAQWTRNVLAAGRAVLITGGRTVVVDRPEIVPLASVVGHLSSTDRRLARLMATTECLHLRPADDGATASPSAAAAA